jgi:transcriptional regulator GlxA family with amidase domain
MGGEQCSGTLLLPKLGLIGTLPACTDLTTKPWVIEAGVTVIDAPFIAHGNIGTAGGCLASHYLATWMIARGGSLDDARAALHYVAPVGEKDDYVDRAERVIAPYL